MGSGRARARALRRASWRKEKWLYMVVGSVRGPVGVSLAAWYKGLAIMAKSGSSDRRIPSRSQMRASSPLWSEAISPAGLGLCQR